MYIYTSLGDTDRCGEVKLGKLRSGLGGFGGGLGDEDGGSWGMFRGRQAEEHSTTATILISETSSEPTESASEFPEFSLLAAICVTQ